MDISFFNLISIATLIVFSRNWVCCVHEYEMADNPEGYKGIVSSCFYAYGIIEGPHGDVYFDFKVIHFMFV